MKTNQLGLELIRHFEGEKLTAYLCPAGIPTISVGVTGKHVKMGMTITQAQSDKMFRDAVCEREPELDGYLDGAKTTPNQYAAMMSLLFNIGPKFGSSSVLRFHKAGDYTGAAKSFCLWNKAKIKGVLVPLKGLTRRREAEARLYRGEYA